MPFTIPTTPVDPPPVKPPRRSIERLRFKYGDQPVVVATLLPPRPSRQSGTHRLTTDSSRAGSQSSETSLARGSTEDSRYSKMRSMRLSARGSVAAEGNVRDFRRSQVALTTPQRLRSDTCKTSLSNRWSADSAGEPPSIEPMLKHIISNHKIDTKSIAPSWSFSHEGGVGGLGKENQDVFFEATPDEHVSIFGVFDGHGKAHGRQAAEVAAASMKEYLLEHLESLKAQPEIVVREAFKKAHDSVLRAFEELPSVTRIEGNLKDRPHYLIELLEEEGDDGVTKRWDASEGGTTATVVVALRIGRIIVAAIGDSAAVLVGRDAAGAVSELLLPEHSPTYVDEYLRMMKACPDAGLRFVYDCPDGELFDIFTTGSDGITCLDREAEKKADDHGCAVKNCRGELMTVVIIPESEIELPSAVVKEGPTRAVVDEQNIAMTRSLGDFYAHHHGVTWEPELRVLESADLLELPFHRPHLLLASDGVWDLWAFNDVAAALLPTDEAIIDEESIAAFCEATRAQGADYFDESADNLTGILVDLSYLIDLLSVDSERDTGVDVSDTNEESSEHEEASDMLRT